MPPCSPSFTYWSATSQASIWCHTPALFFPSFFPFFFMFLTCEFSGTLLTSCTSNPVNRGKDWAPCCLHSSVPGMGLSLRVSQWDEGGEASQEIRSNKFTASASSITEIYAHCSLSKWQMRWNLGMSCNDIVCCVDLAAVSAGRYNTFLFPVSHRKWL